VAGDVGGLAAARPAPCGEAGQAAKQHGRLGIGGQGKFLGRALRDQLRQGCVKHLIGPAQQARNLRAIGQAGKHADRL
jgi:hypothetical protein